MKFEEALVLLTKGKRVRRKGWSGKDCNLASEYGEILRQDGSGYVLHLNEVHADDWEEYVEEDNWNINNLWESEIGGTKVCSVHAVKLLKSKILEDLKKIFEIEDPSEYCKSILEHRIMRKVEKRFGF